MAKIPRPRRDYTRIEEKIASWIFNFLFNVYRAMFVFILLYPVSMLIESVFGTSIHAPHYIEHTLIITGVLFSVMYGFAIYWRITRFRTIPEGWTASQAREKFRLDKLSKGIPDRFSRIYWVVFVGLAGVIEVAGYFLIGSPPITLLYPLSLVAVFAWICGVVIRERTSLTESEQSRVKNFEDLWLAKMRAENKARYKNFGNKILGLFCFIVVIFEMIFWLGRYPIGTLELVSITIAIFVSVIFVRKKLGKRPKLR